MSGLPEKSSGEAISFVDFLATARIKASPRGDLIALFRTLLNAGALPAITCWPDLYHLMTSRRATTEAINEARKFWREYQVFSARKTATRDVPSPTVRGQTP
jgi:hypothetical protein